MCLESPGRYFEAFLGQARKGNLNFRRFGIRRVAKVQNWDSRSCFAGIGNHVLTQRGALFFDFLSIFTDDLKVLCWRGDFLIFLEICRVLQCFAALEGQNS